MDSFHENDYVFKKKAYDAYNELDFEYAEYIFNCIERYKIVMETN